MRNYGIMIHVAKEFMTYLHTASPKKLDAPQATLVKSRMDELADTHQKVENKVKDQVILKNEFTEGLNNKSAEEHHQSDLKDQADLAERIENKRSYETIYLDSDTGFSYGIAEGDNNQQQVLTKFKASREEMEFYYKGVETRIYGLDDLDGNKPNGVYLEDGNGDIWHFSGGSSGIPGAAPQDGMVVSQETRSLQ